MKVIFRILVLTILCHISVVCSAQLTVNPSLTAAQLAQKLTGTGVIVLNTTLNCPTVANGTFVATASNLGLDSGIILTSGSAKTAGTVIGVNGASTLFASTNNAAAGDPDLDIISGVQTHDACVLEFDFVPAGDTIKFDYVFGSEEYPTFNCSYNDVFGFFISGPGITGQQNIALIPGTTVPVGISTINNGSGAVANPPNSCFINTQGHGPYTQYYTTNTGSTVTYNGFTTILQAIKPVIPCDTYHLKLAIADALDWVYDSGVFLKAGSLSSNVISIVPFGGGGISNPTPYCVRGGAPGQFTFHRAQALSTPLTLHYLISGTAVNGIDYTWIPDSIIIPANLDSVVRYIYPLMASPATGPKTVVLKILNPYSCGPSAVVDSAELTILDSFVAIINTHDTEICLGNSIQLTAQGDPLLTYTWTPSATLNNPNIPNPIATPTATTTYTVSAAYPGGGAPAIRHVTVTIKQAPIINLGNDTITCKGVPVQFNATVSPTNQNYIFAWTPPTDLSNFNTATTVFGASLEGDYTYILQADPGAVGCFGYDTIHVKVLPNDFTLTNGDTIICKGDGVNINAIGSTYFTYLWSPTTKVSNPFILNPTISPDTTGTFTVTASYPGCPNKQHALSIEVQPIPKVYLGSDREKCQWDTLQLHAIVSPDWYNQYSYTWSPATNLATGNTQPDIVFNGQQNATYTLDVTTSAGCKGSDNINFIVHQGHFATLSPIGPVGICPLDSIQLNVTGGSQYYWNPNLFLSDSLIANPISKPITDINYTCYVSDIHNCFDTVSLNVVVHPNAIISLPDSIILFPGQSIQLLPTGNCLYFNWLPASGLSNSYISNPIASPLASVRYRLTASTEFGCVTTDSVDLIMNDESVIDVPNAFSPGSAPNAEIKVVHAGFATLNYFRIFNRWGQKMFETTDLNKGWDGQFNNQPQPEGVYIYQVEGFTSQNRKVYKQGNITLIR